MSSVKQYYELAITLVENCELKVYLPICRCIGRRKLSFLYVRREVEGVECFAASIQKISTQTTRALNWDICRNQMKLRS